MSNKILTLLLLIPMMLIFTNSVFAENFSDVKNGHKYYTAINYLKEKGLIQGYSDNTFKPDQNINRAEAVKMILVAVGICKSNATDTTPDVIPTTSNVTSTTNPPKFASDETSDAKGGISPADSIPPFSDTPLDAWYTPHLSLAKEKGLISGYSDSSFHPEATINLAESLKIHFEAIDNLNFIDTASTLFDDTPVNAWFTKYTSYAGAKGIINIYSTNTVNPNQEMTRGYLTEIIYRYLKNAEGYDFGKATFYFGIPGKNNDYYDQNILTTAHKTLPFGTLIEVTNLANGKSVIVKVTDRGPYSPGRVLDLSKTAFSKIASVGTGVINVQYRLAEPEL